MTDQNNNNPELVEDNSVSLINIEEELHVSYLDYAMSVITGRALPDARDGFKPVHRRVIYSMHLDGLTPDKEFVKSAEIVGKVMGTFHPHGDSAIYDTLVRMTQDFSLRYPLIKGQGNFGGRGGESAAAMRYTEAKMSAISQDLIADIDKETVDFVPNYSNKTVEPLVVPTRIPNLLINGSSGIAVGMATNIPSHNLNEVINGTLALIDNPAISINELMTHIPGPDFPTKCTISDTTGIRNAYHTGRGRVILSAIYHIRKEARHNVIVITDLPYQVNYNKIIESINDLAREKVIEGIVDVLNLTKQSIHIEIFVSSYMDPDVVMNQLYSKTKLRDSFGINLLALHEGKPKTFNLKELLEVFVNFRREVITRRSLYNLRRYRNRLHILEGMAIALSNIDQIIHIIRNSNNKKDAIENLMETGWSYENLTKMIAGIGDEQYDVSTLTRPDGLEGEFGIRNDQYYFSKAQATSILEMPLSRLTNLEITTINKEYFELVAMVKDLLDILGSEARLISVLKEELVEVQKHYQVKEYAYDQRICEISHTSLDLDDISFVNKEDVVITLTSDNYIKYQQLSEYQAQKRAGTGRSTSRKMKKNDAIQSMIVANTHDQILCFSNIGKMYRLQVYKLPFAEVNGKGRPINNYLQLQEGEFIDNMVTLTTEQLDNKTDYNIFIVTKSGKIIRNDLSRFLGSTMNPRGVKAVRLLDLNNNQDNEVEVEFEVENQEDDLEVIVDNSNRDQIISVSIVKEDEIVYIFTSLGYCNAYKVGVVPKRIGRNATGVKGIKLKSENDQVIKALFSKEDGMFMTTTNLGVGKRCLLETIPVRVGRTGSGVKIQKLKEELAEKVIGISLVTDDDHLLLITAQGKVIRIAANAISITSRYARGVKLLKLSKNDDIAALERIVNGNLEEDAEVTEIIGTSEDPELLEEVKDND